MFTIITTEKLKNGELESEFPEVYALKSVFENNGWHHETTFEHTVATLEAFDGLVATEKMKGGSALLAMLSAKVGETERIELFRLAILFHDLGKRETLKMEGDITSFHGHEDVSLKEVKDILGRIDMGGEEKNYVLAVVGNHGKPHMAFDDQAGPLAGFGKIKDQLPGIYSDLALLGMVDTMGSKLKEKDPEKFNSRMVVYREILKLK